MSHEARVGASTMWRPSFKPGNSFRGAYIRSHSSQGRSAPTTLDTNRPCATALTTHLLCTAVSASTGYRWACGVVLFSGLLAVPKSFGVALGTREATWLRSPLVSGA